MLDKTDKKVISATLGGILGAVVIGALIHEQTNVIIANKYGIKATIHFGLTKITDAPYNSGSNSIFGNYTLFWTQFNSNDYNQLQNTNPLMFNNFINEISNNESTNNQILQTLEGTFVGIIVALSISTLILRQKK